jgi:hypothetical protein
MNAETLFGLANLAVMPGWMLLTFAPRWRWTQRYTAFAVPLLLGTLYAWLFLRHSPGAEGGFSSLAEVAKLFERPELLLAGWVHYLVFDLFIGSWEVRDAGRHGLPHLLVIPCLVLTFLLGPVGLLLYLILRVTLRKVIDADQGL